MENGVKYEYNYFGMKELIEQNINQTDNKTELPEDFGVKKNTDDDNKKNIFSFEI